ncbi:hypothetical protein RHECNPAF_35000134 [Rhizobium etli CNPAF512]|nr:hypothetical protein RHECNPAF_35000134 [Rhizobium etli CNPAF512]
MLDQRLHRAVHSILVQREGDCRHVDLERPLRHLVDALFDDPHAFAHLVDAASPACIAIALVAGDDVEIEPVVDLVGLIAPDVPVDTGSTQVRAAEAEVDGILGGDHADPLRAIEKHPVIFEQSLIVADPVREDVAKLADLREESVRQILAHAADPAEGGVHARTSDHFQEVHDHFTFAHDVKQCGHGAEIHRQSARDQEVTGDPCQLGHHHADILRPDRCFYAEEFLHRQREGEVVRGWAEIVEPVRQRENLGIGETLRQFFGAAMEVADMRIDALDELAVQFEDEPKNPMGAGVLRTEVEKHFPGIERFALRPAELGDFGHLNVPA